MFTGYSCDGLPSYQFFASIGLSVLVVEAQDRRTGGRAERQTDTHTGTQFIMLPILRCGGIISLEWAKYCSTYCNFYHIDLHKIIKLYNFI